MNAVKFYNAPKDSAGEPNWVPIVVKNKDHIIGFIEGVNMVSSVYNIDRESMFYSLSSERFNDITKNGIRLRDMKDAEFIAYAKSIIDDGFDRIHAMDAADGGDLSDYCLTVQCSCGNFIGYTDYKDIPKTETFCDICQKMIIHYTNNDDECYEYDGIPNRNNKALLEVISNLPSEGAGEVSGESINW